MIRIKTPLGLGDAVYCWPIVKYFAERDSVVLSTKYPEIFNNIKDVQIDNSQNIFDIRLHYNQKRSSKNGQYQDILDQCRLPAISFTFSFRNKKVFDISRVKKKSGDKKICIVKNPHSNDMLKSKNDFSLSPNFGAMQLWINENREKYFYVSVGRDEVIKKRLENVDMNLENLLNLDEYLSIVSQSDAVACQICNLVPIAQGFNVKMKVFAPLSITDRSLFNMGLHKIKIIGVNNEL